jgi:hypothetical protein
VTKKENIMEINVIKNPIRLAALRASAKCLEEQLLEAKKQLRTTWTRPMDSVQAHVHDLKRDVTAHYVLRALLRGRVHPHQARLLKRYLPRVEKLAIAFRRDPRPEEAAAMELEARAKPGLVERLVTRINGASNHAVG